MNKLDRSAQYDPEFYHYCLSGRTDRDAHYFTRNGSNPSGNTHTYDHQLAMILANEQIREFLVERLNRSLTALPALIWTGSKTDLIELIYALQAAAVFNNGEAQINTIAQAFQRSFGLDLGDIYRTFQDIRIRKKSQTPFLERLTLKLVNRISELDGRS